MNSITVTLLGEPVAFARMRLSSLGVHFTPSKQRNTAAALSIEAQRVMLVAGNGMGLFNESLRVDLTAEFSIPASWSRRKQAAALAGEIRPGKRPDIDNLYKLAADALNGIVYRDDALIVEAAIRKIYSNIPKITINVQPIITASSTEKAA